MSQTIVPAAPAGGPGAESLDGPAGAAPASGTLQDRVRSAWAGLRHSLSGSPGKLRIVSGVTVLAAVLVAFGGGAALRERSSAIDDAAATSGHLILLQRVQTNLVQADADVTNSFLGFGLEPQAQQLDYIASIKQASTDLAMAADAGSADGAALGTVNAELTRYTGYVSSARALNRHGIQVGKDYLGTASDLLNDPKTGILAQVTARTKADQAKIDAAYTRASHAALWLALVVIVGVGGLLGSQLYLTRLTHRFVNLPLAAATLGVLIALIVAVGAMSLAESKANDVRNGALSKATDLSNSRVAAFSAKSNESLTLIARGSATSDDKAWSDLMGTASARLPAGNQAAAAALTAYAKEHAAINALDVAGSWRPAIDRAIASGRASGNAQFKIYSDQTANALNAQAAETASGLGSAGNALLPAGILVLLMGLLAAVGAWWGVTLRLDEYR